MGTSQNIRLEHRALEQAVASAESRVKWDVVDGIEDWRDQKMRKLALLLILAILAAGCGTARYNSEPFHLSFRPPRGWQCFYYNEQVYGEMIQCTPIPAQSEQEGCCGPVINIYADPWDLRTHSESITAAALLAARVQGSYSGTDITANDIQSTQIGGQDAAWYDKEESGSDGCTVATRQILVHDHARTVSIRGRGPKESWGKLSAALQDISASMSFSPPPTSVAATPTPEQQTVDALEAFLRSAGAVPDQLMQRDARKSGGEFDINQVFSVLTHLSMQPGYVLDYVYLYELSGGEPILYARPAEQPPYGTYSDYVAALGVPSYTELESIRHKYLDYVVADGTDEGYFELVALRVKGGQFYQYWHAAYNDYDILCDRTGLEALLVVRRGLPADVRQKARELSLEPVITQDGNTVTVRVVTFTEWGGFVEESYSIQRDFPHNVTMLGKKTLVEYNSGLRF